MHPQISHLVQVWGHQREKRKGKINVKIKSKQQQQQQKQQHLQILDTLATEHRFVPPSPPLLLFLTLHPPKIKTKPLGIKLSWTTQEEKPIDLFFFFFCRGGDACPFTSAAGVTACTVQMPIYTYGGIFYKRLLIKQILMSNKRLLTVRFCCPCFSVLSPV